MFSSETNCEIYRDANKSTFVFSVLIAVGIVISYLPQYATIVSTRTSIGLSPIFLLLISIAGISAMSNLILLSFISIPCCSQISKFECANSQISLIQVGLQAISTILIPWFCVKFTKNEDNEFQYKEIVGVWKGILAYGGIIGISLIASFFLLSNTSILIYAQILGIFSTVLTVVQYTPQLYTTYKLKHSGVLSKLMMLIQTPGGFIWTATLMLKPGANWSSWLPYLTAAVFQGLVLLLTLYYDFIRDEKSLPILENADVNSYDTIA